jgi:hypothetical protein
VHASLGQRLPKSLKNKAFRGRAASNVRRSVRDYRYFLVIMLRMMVSGTIDADDIERHR